MQNNCQFGITAERYFDAFKNLTSRSAAIYAVAFVCENGSAASMHSNDTA